MLLERSRFGGEAVECLAGPTDLGGAPWAPSRYLDPGGRERARTFARKADAQWFLAGVESDKSRGLYVDLAAGRVSMGEYAQQWQASQVHRRTTAANFDSHLRNHILPTFGDRPLAAVTRLEVQAWVKSRIQVLAPTTIRTVYAVLRMIFRAAVADRLIAVSPCERNALPRLLRRDVVPLSRDSVLALVEGADDRYRAIIVVAAGTGLRQGEVFGLAPDRVDFLRRQLVVDAQLVLLPGGGGRPEIVRLTDR